MRKLMQGRGAAAFNALKADLEERVRLTHAGKAKPFDPHALVAGPLDLSRQSSPAKRTRTTSIVSSVNSARIVACRR